MARPDALDAAHVRLGIAPERMAELARVCLTPIGKGKVCGHALAQHFGTGPCIAGHRPKGGEKAPASVCPCLRYSDGSHG